VKTKKKQKIIKFKLKFYENWLKILLFLSSFLLFFILLSGRNWMFVAAPHYLIFIGYLKIEILILLKYNINKDENTNFVQFAKKKKKQMYRPRPRPCFCRGSSEKNNMMMIFLHSFFFLKNGQYLASAGNHRLKRWLRPCFCRGSSAKII